jgi:ribonucleotide monophosphatase NagD (HAD superfamily)
MKPPHASPLLGAIFDIDCVLEYQGKVYPGAIETIQRLRQGGLRLRFLTNSTLKSHVSAAEKLRRKGFDIRDDEVFTASYLTALYLRSLAPRSIWLMLEREGRDEFTDFTHDSENPQYVVVGDYRDNFNFASLNKALRLDRP